MGQWCQDTTCFSGGSKGAIVKQALDKQKDANKSDDDTKTISSEGEGREDPGVESKSEATRQLYAPTVSQINGLESQISSLFDSKLTDGTALLTQRAQNRESLDSLLPEVLFCTREK